MKGTITQADLEAAKENLRKTDRVTNGCLVWQVAKRLGLDPEVCWFNNIYLKDGREIRLSFTTQKITAAFYDNWPRYVGEEVEFIGV